MLEVRVKPVCSVRYLSKAFNLDSPTIVVFEKGASFSLGAEGFFMSLTNELGKREKLSSIKVHLTRKEIEQYGILKAGYLCSPCFISICTQNVPIIDRYGAEITDLLIEKVSDAVNMDHGAYESGQSYALYALDPYFQHPPALNFGNTDPSDEDFRTLLASKIEEHIIGRDADSKESLERIANSMSLYVFLKEVWENTIHHARSPHRSLRYIKLSRAIYNNESDINSADLPLALTNYLKCRSKNDGTKKYLIVDVADSGSGLYNTLKGVSKNKEKLCIIKAAFQKHSSSKVQHNAIVRGLGLFTAMKCANELRGLVVMTTSGTLCVNYDSANDKFLADTKVISLKNVMSDDLSTSLSLIIPV
ncbi:hypothetical protein KTT58_21330 [Pseudomonas viridiflava]|uniref:hypothetical protein n=1 Tax=Pseudomonas viridiflava TaxID=33069 RepID=UPI001C2D5C57|nr:hypothetical protein [Pseudomonas viridiflava]MBV1815283.1 hypothetical protein [Pseudomonas viridiflava]